MASAETTKVTVSREEDGVTLTLNKDEADFLLDLLAHVGGIPSTSRRGLASGISNVLYDVGVYGTDYSDFAALNGPARPGVWVLSPGEDEAPRYS